MPVMDNDPNDFSPWYHRAYTPDDIRYQMAAAGWTKEQIVWLEQHKAKLIQRDGELAAQEYRRQVFIRWLVVSGRLTDWPDGCPDDANEKLLVEGLTNK